MSINLCNTKKCVNRNQFGYCILNGPCEYPELKEYPSYDNKTDYESDKDPILKHKYPYSGQQQEIFNNLVKQEDRDFERTMNYLEKWYNKKAQ